MENPKYHQRLLFIISYTLLIFNFVQSKAQPVSSPQISPNSNPPVASPTPDSTHTPTPAQSPTPTADSPRNHLNFPTSSISDRPSGSAPPTAESPHQSTSDSSSSPGGASGNVESPDQVNAQSTSDDVGISKDGQTSILGALGENKVVLPSFIRRAGSVKRASADVKKICDTTDDPSLCVSTVSPFIKGKADTMTVLDASVKASANLAKFSFNMAQKMAQKPGTPPELAAALKDCKESYDDALNDFQRVIDALPSRDIGTINTRLSAVLTRVGDCEDVFKKLGSNSPLSNYAEKLSTMTSNCLAVASLA